MRVDHIGMRDDEVVGRFEDRTELSLRGHLLVMRIDADEQMRPFKLSAALRSHAVGHECIEMETCLSGPRPEPGKDGRWTWTCYTLAPFRMDAARRAVTQAMARRNKAPDASPWPFGDSYLENATLYVTVQFVVSPWSMDLHCIDWPVAVDTYAWVKTHPFARSSLRHTKHQARYTMAACSPEVSDDAFHAIAARIFSVAAVKSLAPLPTTAQRPFNRIKTKDGWTFVVPQSVFELPRPMMRVDADAVHVAAVLWHAVTGKSVWDPNSSMELADVARALGADKMCRAMLETVVPKDELLRRVMCPLLRSDLCPLLPSSCGGEFAVAKRAAKCILENARAVGMVDAYI